MAKRVRSRLTAAQGRRFGLTVGLAFAALGVVMLWREHQMSAIIAWSVGGALVLIGLVAPTTLDPVERAWMAMAHGISKITTPLFMGIVYFLVLMPIGVVMRWFGRNPMVHSQSEAGFWRSRAETEGTRGNMHRQF